MDNWQSLREAYIASEESLGKLAEEFSVDARSAYRRCRAEGWVKLRKERMKREKEKDPLVAAADALLARVRQVLEGEETLDVKSMRDLATVLKDIRSMQHREDGEDEGVRVTLNREVIDYSE